MQVDDVGVEVSRDVVKAVLAPVVGERLSPRAGGAYFAKSRRDALAPQLPLHRSRGPRRA
jgi:hypothetical protein